MKTVSKFLLLCAFSPMAMAQFSVSDEITGAATQAVTLDYMAQNNLRAIQVQLTYDPASLTPQTTNTPPFGEVVDGCLATPGGNWNTSFSQCVNTAPGTILVTISSGFQNSDPALDTQMGFGTITFDIAGGTPGDVFPINTTVTQAVQNGSSANNPSDLTANPGSISIQAPPGAGFYSSTPAPGATIDFGAAVVGVETPTVDLTFQNPSPDTAYDVTGFTAPAIVTTAPVTPITVPAMGGSVAGSFACTPATRGTVTGTWSVQHDAANGAASPVDYGYSCTGLGPNVNVAPATVSLNGLTTDAADPTGTITVTNPQDGFTSEAAVSSSAAGNAEISVAPAGPVTVLADGSTDFTVSCDRTAAGNFTATVTISWVDENGAQAGNSDVAVDCEILDEFPTYMSDPADGTPVNFGTVTNGTTSAPVAVDVYNTGNGSTAASELNIISATITGPDAAAFDVTVNNFGPYPVVGAPDGGADFEITCSPPAAAGALSATLEIVHNDAPNSPATHALSCSGQTDAVFGSTPADGDTLNLGTVPPATITPPGDIVFTNAGAVDSYGVECTVTDPDGVFSFTPDPIALTIPAGGSDSASFQCSPSAPGIFQATVDCSVNGADVVAASYTVTCQGQPLVIPTLDRWGLLLMALAVLALGGFAGRRMMA